MNSSLINTVLFCLINFIIFTIFIIYQHCPLLYYFANEKLVEVKETCIKLVLRQSSLSSRYRYYSIAVLEILPQ